MNMKKRTIALILLLVSIVTTKSIAQYVYYDAIALRKLIDPNTGKWKESDKSIIADTLSHYCAKSDVASVFFNNNPFIKDFASDFASRSGLSGPLNKINIAGVENLDVTNIANGVASLMIERAKQELTIAFFNRFSNFVKNNPEFQILFPKTTDNLTNLLSYTYPQMMPVLRSGFFDDLKQLTYNLEGVLELPRYQKLFANFPEIRIAIRTLRILHEIEAGTLTAADAINSFANFQEWTDPNATSALKNIGSTVKIASIFSQSLRSKDDGKIWVSSTEIKNLINDNIATTIFLGLLYQQFKNAGIKYFFSNSPANGSDFADIFASQKNNLLLIQNRISQFISVAEEVNTAYDNIHSKNLDGEKNTDSDYYNYVNVSIDVIDYSFSIVKIFDDRLSDDQYLSIARKSNNLYKDIYSKQYTQAVNDAIDVLTQVHDLIDKNSTTIPDKDDILNKLLTFVNKVKPYALFMANIAEAKTSDDVKAALENVILPVGSSSIKKNTEFNVSIQSYLGAFGKTSKSNGSINGTWSDAFGVTAPIGISITPGFLSWQKCGSVSVFVPLFDIGAIVDYQLKMDSAVNNSGTNSNVIAKNYSIKLGQIVSPGAYLVYGFGANLPLSLGFGAQYGPGLSKIDGGGNPVIGNPSWRWNFFLAVDLPFFNIVNKSKTK